MFSITFTFSHFADAFIQSDLQLNYITLTYQNNLTIFYFRFQFQCI